MKNAKYISISSVILALCFIFLYLASILPTSRLSCLCLASAGICIVIAECGAKWGFITSLVLSILSWVLLPDKTVGILFILFFSYYPLIKLFAERRGRLSEWIIKALYFLLITVAGLFILKTIGLIPEKIQAYFKSMPLLLSFTIVVLAVECIFDFALSIVISYYTSKIMPKIRKNGRKDF